MRKIVIADDSERDAQRFRLIIEKVGLQAEVCNSGSELASCLDGQAADLVALFILWELPGPPFGSELLLRSRRRFPELPVIVVSSALDTNLAARANDLGAYDVLEKPLDPERIKSCLQSLLRARDPLSSHMEDLKQRIIGDSLPLLSTLKQVARAIKHDAKRVLLIGESGTGKELLARAFHELGSQKNEPFVAVNVAAISEGLIESELFGHEKGAFTGAGDAHRGYLEQSAAGTLFLDELGELELSLQATLLRAIQEKKFRRVKGTHEIDFRAHLVCATNLDLARAVQQGTFRKDLFHRVAEATVQIPPLRDREGDIDQLLEHFLTKYANGRPARFARETLTVLRSYSYPGNVRELENCVRGALMECEDELILPKHLPLATMAAFSSSQTSESDRPKSSSEPHNSLPGDVPDTYQELFRELISNLPANWRDLPYKEMFVLYERAFDRIYLPQLISKHHHNVTQATKAISIDKKTFAQHWRAAGLPPLRGKGQPDE